MELTRETLAALLHGREYRFEIDAAEIAKAKAAGLVVVYGASVDLVELRGAIDDEVGTNDGTTLHLHGGDKPGVLIAWDDLDKDDETEVERYFDRKRAGTRVLEAVWSPAGHRGLSWEYRTDVPHSVFTIIEDGEPYCDGIVFSVADLGPKKAAEPEDPEDWYDVEIAPALAALAKLLQERGMSIVASVEYADGERGDTYGLTDGASLSMRMLHLAALTVPNVDQFLLSLIKHCRDNDVDTSSSIALRNMGYKA